MSKTPISFRLPDELLEQLRAHAAKDNRTLSNLVETMLTKSMTEEKRDAIAALIEQIGISHDLDDELKADGLKIADGFKIVRVTEEGHHE